MTYPTRGDLQSRLRRACLAEDSKRITFMLGSGASLGSVPGTSTMVEMFRKSISNDPDDASDFDVAVNGRAPEHRYRAAAKFLIERAGLPHLNRVVRYAVIGARSPRLPEKTGHEYAKSESRLRDLEDDYRGWAVPQGIAALGRIIAMMPPDVRGPILTTNFDPLVEVSLRMAGLNPFPLAMDGDGAIMLGELPVDIVPVVHLHGSWRLGDTLHTSAQLEHSRPKLLGSLRSLLSNTICCVVGYGGWDDVLTSAMLDIVNEGAQRELEVLWASHGGDPTMGALSTQALPGRIQPYVSVDCNQLFQGLDAALARSTSSRSRIPRPALKIQAVSGATVIDREFVEVQEARERSDSGAVSYFDGREPNWLDVVSPRSPLLTRYQRAMQVIDKGVATLLTGPTGEGKSTLLRQLAVNLGRSDQVVYWVDPTSVLKPQPFVDQSETSRRIYILVDDADLNAEPLLELVEQLRQAGRTDISVVAASRDTDWARSTARATSRAALRHFTTIAVDGIELEDAELIVEAWEEYGGNGLGRLSSVPHEERPQRLFDASLDSGSSALLGALLSVRYQGVLHEHIRELLARLERSKLPNGGSLLEAFILICLVGEMNQQAISGIHLGWVFGLDARETQRLIVDRLGREAAAQRHGELVVPRHHKVAEIALTMADEFSISKPTLAERWVESVVTNIRGRRWGVDDVAVAFAGQRIGDESLALAAARGAVSGDPYQLRLRSAQVGILRRLGRDADAKTACEDAWTKFPTLTDTRIALRGFYREWARCIGARGEPELSAALNAVSLLDLEELDRLDQPGAIRGLAGLALSLALRGSDATGNFCEQRGVLAEEAISLRPDADVLAQLERTLHLAEEDGYVNTHLGNDQRRIVVQNAIKAAIQNCSHAAVVPYRRRSSEVHDLLGLLGLG